MQGKLISRYLGVSTQVMELPGAELEGFQEALDILLKKDNVSLLTIRKHGCLVRV